MNATATVVAEGDGRGGTRLARLRSQAPMALRPTPHGVYLVGGAAGPIGGDRIALEIVVGAGAELTIRSVAAAVVLPGPVLPALSGRSGPVPPALSGRSGPVPSVVDVAVRVAAGGSLSWLTEPVVAAAGCRHRMRARVVVERGGRLVWREELVLGRHRETGGALTSRMSLDVAGHPVLRHELVVDDGHACWASPAVGNGARAAGSLVVVDPDWELTPPPPALIGQGIPRAALLPLAGPAVQVTALADEAATLRTLLEQGLARLRGNGGPICGPGRFPT